MLPGLEFLSQLRLEAFQFIHGGHECLGDQVRTPLSDAAFSITEPGFMHIHLHDVGMACFRHFQHPVIVIRSSGIDCI